MKSIQVTRPGAVTVAEVDAPRPRAGEALLRVCYAGICGSDIQTFRGTQPFASYPRVPGHEFSAEIVELGGASEDFAVGDVVTGVPYFQDGTCYSCRRGLINACVHNETMGVHRDGAFQELITMPLDRLHTADGVDPRDLALVEPFSIGYHAVLRADVAEGVRVLVLGAGAIGLLTKLSALTRGAEVWIADDVVCEATGLPVSFLNAVEASAVGARIVLIGNGTREVTFNQSTLIKKELTVLGSRNSAGVFDTLIDLLARKVVDVSPLRTRIVPLTGAAEALESAAQGASGEIKVLIEFPAGS
ncbi:zinc-binding alcohol dehydrogenase family protein [Brachybacterium aquaticum]|uniref:Threonine dehydrogenase-like Zn-dependent dehydrogenase n=1 Tax=Brachybacterium aquaticum TaxID=1432564 RepID=A0A841AGF2_9MICO|nr:zinc-binding alcohol dehydrogenase family protein [Brachybacterium aquaticum]MBB5832360.1 threonine dehydrogenase-like Zn-dependent dehydrogenase [Brachybacterium aquaticum]